MKKASASEETRKMIETLMDQEFDARATMRASMCLMIEQAR